MQKLIEKGTELYKKHKQIADYVIIGGATTVINYAVYFAYSRLIGDIITANTVAWLISVIFAFFANKLIVFRVKFSGAAELLREAGLFAGARVFSGVVEAVILGIGANVLGINDLLVKAAAAVIIIIMNFFLSKFIVFAKPNKEKQKNEETVDSDTGLQRSGEHSEDDIDAEREAEPPRY